MGNDRIDIAVSWAAACGGCDVAILDSEARILDLAAVADIAYWPVATDGKRADLRARLDGSIDVGVFNGAIRTSEQEEDARLFRAKCKLLVAMGSCACFGGIPGLANLFDREEILDTAYRTTPSTENPECVRPQTVTDTPAGALSLPAFSDRVRCLADVVPVDVFVPGCPPPAGKVGDLLDAVLRYAEDGTLPPAGAWLASDRALCSECPRNQTRKAERIEAIRRPHELAADSGECFLDQGLVCLGIATRGGCDGTCMAAGMPCRGCFGPAPGALDPAADAISVLGSIAGAATENDVPEHEWKKAVRSVRDPAGTFYRYTLPASLLGGRVTEEKRP